MNMIARFSLYGFLKNQQYYEPFLILIFREKGLSFLQIGALIGFRELMINLFEVPSGAVADLYGRRRSMIFCFCAFIASFLVFAFSSTYWHLFAAMLLFALGDAFRTGTHKAIILNWLELEGRTKERTRVYGITRSWAQAGSALSVLVAAGLVFYTGRYSVVFLFCIVPYLLGLINFFSYPSALEGKTVKGAKWTDVVRLTWRSALDCLTRRRLRRLLAESLGFQGMYKVAKDYLQPVLKTLAVSSVLLASLSDPKRAAVVVGLVYFVLHILDTLASRQAHRVTDWTGDDDRAAGVIWLVAGAIYAGIAFALWGNASIPAVAGFVLLAVAQNFWRPLQVGRLGTAADSDRTATILSVESQSVSLFAAVVAPVVGYLVDLLKTTTGWIGVRPFTPVAAVGFVVVAVIVVFTRPLARAQSAGEAV